MTTTMPPNAPYRPSSTFPVAVAAAQGSSILQEILNEPHSLATLGAACAVCDHPADVRVDLWGELDGLEPPARGVWCALCGSVGTQPIAKGEASWTRPTMAQLITREHVRDFQALAVGLASLTAAIDRIDPSRRAPAVCDVLRGACEDLLRSPALARVDELAHAIDAVARW